LSLFANYEKVSSSENHLWDAIPPDRKAMPRITEAEIADIIIDYLNEKASGWATIQELLREIPNRVTLSAQDLA
jgi:hypothetical protein